MYKFSILLCVLHVMFKNKNCVFIRLQPGNWRALSVFKHGFLLIKLILWRRGLHAVKHTGLNARFIKSLPM